MVWKPKVTVAAVIQQDCKFLLIEVLPLLFNIPADHLKSDASLQGAVVRIESAYEFKPQYLIGIFLWHATVHSTINLRLAFAGRIPRPLFGTGA